jgi:hypothetical protein
VKYLARLTDAAQEHMVLLTLPPEEVQKPAVDVVFDLVGLEKPEELVTAGVISEAQLEDLKVFQRMIFDRDATGLFIKDGVSFTANGKELNPDLPFEKVFVAAELDGMKYLRCDLKVVDLAAPPRTVPYSIPGNKLTQDKQVELFAQVMFLHQLFLSANVDVTKDHPELEKLIHWGEQEELIEIDVQKASYRLTNKGKSLHDSYIQEAQDLIKRFDIYSDVDIDSKGNVRFDTGLGKDLRIPVFELSGVDPFRARFLLGVNDGEWDQLSNWEELIEDIHFYERIFEPIECAPSVEDIGQATLIKVQDEGKALLRRESQSR